MKLRLLLYSCSAVALVSVLLLLSPMPASGQAQDLIVDICTTPNQYWNREVMLKGHVVRVTPDPPGTNRGRFTLRDHSDKDIEITTDDLPAQGKIYIVKGVVEQRRPGDTVPFVRELSRILSTDLADGPAAPGDTAAKPATPAKEASAPPARAKVVSKPPTQEEIAELVRRELEKKAELEKRAKAESAALPAAIPESEPWWKNQGTLLIGAVAVVALIAIIALATRRKPDAAHESAPAPPVQSPAYPPPPAAGPPDVRAAPPATAAPAAGGAATIVASRGTEIFTTLGASFQVVEGPDRGRQFPLGRVTTTIGRPGHRINDIELTDTTVSREQARIVFDSGARTFTLFNESSTNPTRVNGREASNVALQDGDSIEFGSTSAKFKKG